MATAYQQRLAALDSQDFAAFIGPNFDKYERLRERQVEKGRLLVLSWAWLAFLLPVAWLAYRRQYGAVFLVGLLIALDIAASIAFETVMPGMVSVSAVIGIMLAVRGREFILQAAMKAAEKADRQRLFGSARYVFLAKQGGTSKLAGWLIGLLHIPIIIAFGLALSDFMIAATDGRYAAPAEQAVPARQPLPALRPSIVEYGDEEPVGPAPERRQPHRTVAG